MMKSSFSIQNMGLSTAGGPVKTGRLATDATGQFVEMNTGRRVRLNGINFASNAKLPSTPFQGTYMKPDKCKLYTEGDTVSFVGKPFPLCDAYEHLTRIKQCGFNTIRFVFTWEAVEHEGPGIYDLEYADYVVEVLKKVDEVGGIYVFMDPHQDVWSRFTGGSGAPLWTLYAAGLEPKHFKDTLAAKTHYDSENPENYTKMVWTTNYHRLASEVMFTMFFSGARFLPKCIIDDVNIQEYLQGHFIEAVAFLINHIKTSIPEIFRSCFIGVETMNEPNAGMYAYEDLNYHPKKLELKLDEMPTPIQSMRLGMGQAQNVESFYLSIFGPMKKENVLWDPKGVKAWVENDSMDKHYGFNRSDQWKLGECIFAQHGIWDILTGELLIPEYFKTDEETGGYMDETTFINGPFLETWKRFRKRMRAIDDEMFLILQPPVLKVPPKLKNTDLIDNKCVIALHYYDGMSLMFKTWNRYMNVDTLGIVRGRYLNPVFGIVLGESNIRKSIAKQLGEMYQESKQIVGDTIPVIFTETGMPFDMDDKKAFSTDDYSSQISALDALLTALELNNLNFTFWTYNPDNIHKWGDIWNLEDFSIWSINDSNAIFYYEADDYIEWLAQNGHDSLHSLKNENLADRESIASTEHTGTTSVTGPKGTHKELVYSLEDRSTASIDLTSGIRGAVSCIRPFVASYNGELLRFEFSITSKVLCVEIRDTGNDSSFNQGATEDSEQAKLLNGQLLNHTNPTVIMLPALHYPEHQFRVEISSGAIVVKRDCVNQWIEWSYTKGTDTKRLDVIPIDLRDESPSTESGLKALACGYL